MPFYADLHVHSRYSRATSKNLDLEHLALWAQKKGISVLATGDFTHPAWRAELKEKLVPAEPGLFRLRQDIESDVARRVGVAGAEPVRFMLEVEISTIYKKGEKTRKVHHLIYAPDFEKAKRIVDALDRIGNLSADGRPILGLDSRDLLEITLEGGEGCYLVPAHIWTPWFSALGSKSGFDSIAACYGDLAEHIFTVETGLSSDPPMNWRLSALDQYTLVSNSDAHSPSKLGREVCLFETEMEYFAMKRALETGEGAAGTVEFYPEEGKYHLDGHRKCDVRLTPDETRRLDGICPTCGKPLTVGVLHRVHDLADRDEESAPQRAPFHSMIPLVEVLSEIQEVGPKSKKVQGLYERALAGVGAELYFLKDAPLEDIRQLGLPLLDEAVRRMRADDVIREPGYDGEYGVIRLFTDDELLRRHAIGTLFDLPAATEATDTPDVATFQATEPGDGLDEPYDQSSDQPESTTPEQLDLLAAADQRPAPETSPILASLDPDQRRAARVVDGPLLIVAGPGTGKTRTLTHRIAYLIAEHDVSPQECLAITFTRRAAEEMRSRLAALAPDAGDELPVMTFHSLGLSLLQEYGHLLDLPKPIQVAAEQERRRILAEALGISQQKAKSLLADISSAARSGQEADADLERVRETYQAELRAHSLVDFDDLIQLSVRLLEEYPEVRDECRQRYRWVSIDEYQDVDAWQYRLVRSLVPAAGNVCVIGDPDQAIYGFRGSDVRFFQRFQDDYPTATTIQLTRNYRSSATIVDAALQAIAPASLVSDRTLEAQHAGVPTITIRECATDKAEAEFVVHTIERLLGGSTFFSFDSGRVEVDEGEPLSFADIGVLYRTNAQADLLEEAFARSGIPYQQRSHQSLAEHPVVETLVERMRAMPADTPLVERLDTAAENVTESDQDQANVHRLVEALRPLAERHGTDVEGFCSELALGMDVDLWDPRAQQVSLLTLHASKGLEFRVVFLVGCEDGILPLRWGDDDETDTDEERRLFFVGITRAEERLFLTHARRRRWRGKIVDGSPSPFLADIEERLLERDVQESQARDTSSGQQLELF